MKKSIFWQVLTAMLILCLVIFIIIALLMPGTLKNFFTKEAYQAISISQNQLLLSLKGDNPDYNLFGDPNAENIRNVNHLLFLNERLYASKFPPVELAEKMVKEANSQTENEKKYHSDDVFYIIKKIPQGFISSYLPGSYRDDLTGSLYKSLIFFMIVAVVLSIIPAYYFSKKITNPLKELAGKVDTLSKGKWDEEIKIERYDEIGELSNSIEHLRHELIKKDEAQSDFLQNVSHDLKTPVMVIESFAEAIKDGIYPKGDLMNSADTITTEAKVLKSKIQNLLMVNRLEYFEDRDEPKEEINIADIIRSSIEKFKPLRAEVEIKAELQSWVIEANRQSIESAIDNLLDNQMRYAYSEILILSEKDYIKIQNDGEELDDEYLKDPFNKFQKGNRGNFGLGLNIVKKVFENSGYKLRAFNEEGRATFVIEKSKI